MSPNVSGTPGGTPKGGPQSAPLTIPRQVARFTPEDDEALRRYSRDHDRPIANAIRYLISTHPDLEPYRVAISDTGAGNGKVKS